MAFYVYIFLCLETDFPEIGKVCLFSLSLDCDYLSNQNKIFISYFSLAVIKKYLFATDVGEYSSHFFSLVRFLFTDFDKQYFQNSPFLVFSETYKNFYLSSSSSSNKNGNYDNKIAHYRRIHCDSFSFSEFCLGIPSFFVFPCLLSST